MTGYVISVNSPEAAKSYFSSRGGYTFDLNRAKVFDTYKEADAQLMILAGANTAVARYGQVEEA